MRDETQEQLQLQMEMAKAKAAMGKAPPVEIDPLPAPKEDSDPLGLGPKGYLGSALRGAHQGLTLGFGDEALGAMDTYDEANRRLRQKIGLEDAPKYDPEPAVNLQPGHITSTFRPGSRSVGDEPYIPAAEGTEKAQIPLLDYYRNLRDQYRGENKTAQETHPLVYGGAELAGTMALPTPGSKVKAATTLGRIGKGALTAGTMGSAMGAGGSEADLTKGEVGPLVEDVLTSAAPAAALGGSFGYVGPKVEDFFGKVAGKYATKAVGGDFADKGSDLTKPGQSEYWGKKFLEDKLVPVLRGKKYAAKNALREAVAQDATYGNLIDDAARAKAAKEVNSPGFNKEDIRKLVKENLSELDAKRVEEMLNKIEEETPGMYDPWKMEDPTNVPPSVENELIRQGGNPLAALRDAKSNVKTHLGDDALKQLQDAYLHRNTAEVAQGLLERAQEKEGDQGLLQKLGIGHGTGGLIGAAGVGAHLASELTGHGGSTIPAMGAAAAAALAAKLAKERGPQTAAHGFDLASKFVGGKYPMSPINMSVIPSYGAPEAADLYQSKLHDFFNPQDEEKK